MDMRCIEMQQGTECCLCRSRRKSFIRQLTSAAEIVPWLTQPQLSMQRLRQLALKHKGSVTCSSNRQLISKCKTSGMIAIELLVYGQT